MAIYLDKQRLKELCEPAMCNFMMMKCESEHDVNITDCMQDYVRAICIYQDKLIFEID